MKLLVALNQAKLVYMLEQCKETDPHASVRDKEPPWLVFGRS